MPRGFVAGLTPVETQMRLFFDLDSGGLIAGPGYRQPVNSLTFVRGDHPKIEIQFVEGGTAIDPNPENVWFCVRPKDKFAGDYLVLSEGMARDAARTTPVWSAQVSFNTRSLNALLGHGTEPQDDDIPFITATGEVGFAIDGHETSSIPFSVKIYHDLYKGDTSQPDDAVSGWASEAARRAEKAADRAENAIYTANPVPANPPDGAFRFRGDVNGVFFQLKSATTGAFHSLFVRGDVGEERVSCGPADTTPNPLTGFAPCEPPNGNYRFKTDADGAFQIHLKHKTSGTFHPIFIRGEPGTEQLVADPAI